MPLSDAAKAALKARAKSAQAVTATQGRLDVDTIAAVLDAEPVVNPLDSVIPTGDLEVDSANELDAYTQAYRARIAAENERRLLATDSEHWFAVNFRNRGDKERFLAALGLLEACGDKYLDGYAAAALLGVDLTEGATT